MVLETQLDQNFCWAPNKWTYLAMASIIHIDSVVFVSINVTEKLK
jgi:hypothetical protein